MHLINPTVIVQYLRWGKHTHYQYVKKMGTSIVSTLVDRNARWSILAFILLVGMGHTSSGQNQEKTHSFSYGYLGEYYTHAGQSAAYTHDLRSVLKEKTKRNGQVKSKTRSFFLHHSLAFYSQKELYRGLVLTSAVGTRKKRAGGFFTQVAIGGGYFRSFNTGTTYEVKEDRITQVPLAGSNAFVGNLSFGLGHDLEKWINVPVSAYLNHGLWLRYPYNDFLIPQLYMEIGLTYQFNK